jgi:hypothetical protein
VPELELSVEQALLIGAGPHVARLWTPWRNGVGCFVISLLAYIEENV